MKLRRATKFCCNNKDSINLMNLKQVKIKIV